MGVTLDVPEGKTPQVPAECPADYNNIVVRCWKGKPQGARAPVQFFLNSATSGGDVA